MKLTHPAISFLGRILISYIFVTSGLAKVFGWSGNVQYMSRHHLPMIPLLLSIALVIELAGSVCLITGFHARIAALIMALYLAAVTVSLHNYWAYSGDLASMQETHFRKNLAIVGGLLMIAAQGAGRWAFKRERENS